MAVPAQQQQRPLPPNVDSFFGAVTGTAGEALREGLSYTSGFNEKSGAGYISADNLNRAPLRNVNKPEEFASYPDGDAKWLQDKSGYKTTGTNTIYDTVIEREAEERKKEEKTAQYARNIMTTAVAVGALNQFASFQRTMAIEEAPRVVQESQMLYVDQNGRPVSHDAPGAQLVATAEEKAAIEDRTKTCLGGLSADQTTLIDGVRVNAEDYTRQQAMLNKAADVEITLQKLEDGKITTAELSPDEQKAATYWQENGERLTKLQEIPEGQRTPEQQAELKAGQKAFMGDEWKEPSLNGPLDLTVKDFAPPAAAFTPTPQMQTPQLTVTAPAPAPPTSM